MSYHLTILRTAQGRQLDITLNEAKSAAEDVANWTYNKTDDCLTFTSSQGTIDIFHDEGELWLQGFNGEAWQLEAMLALANTLNARVRGDELETYESIDKTYFHPDDQPLKKAGEEFVQKSLKESKRIRNFIVGFFVILAIIAGAIGKLFEN